MPAAGELPGATSLRTWSYCAWVIWPSKITPIAILHHLTIGGSRTGPSWSASTAARRDTGPRSCHYRPPRPPSQGWLIVSSLDVPVLADQGGQVDGDCESGWHTQRPVDFPDLSERRCTLRSRYARCRD